MLPMPAQKLTPSDSSRAVIQSASRFDVEGAYTKSKEQGAAVRCYHRLPFPQSPSSNRTIVDTAQLRAAGVNKWDSCRRSDHPGGERIIYRLDVSRQTPTLDQSHPGFLSEEALRDPNASSHAWETLILRIPRENHRAIGPGSRGNTVRRSRRFFDLFAQRSRRTCNVNVERREGLTAECLS